MKAFIRIVSPRLIALLAALSLLIAQGGAQAQGAYAYSQQELDQMLAPIALYPDPLLSQILLAATYPMEVLEAARWSREQPELSGEEAVRAAEGENWDPSVKALLAFPQVLASMSGNPQWMQSLGDAFLAQQAQVMNTVQELRHRAQAAGGLGSDDHVRLVASGPDLLLQPLDPGVIHVPYYDPLVVFGSWWWPAYPPVLFRPWQRHYARPGHVRGSFWGPPVVVSTGFFFSAFDWPRRQLQTPQGKYRHYRHGQAANRPIVPNRAPGAWRREAERRTGSSQSGAAAAPRLVAPGAPQNQHSRIGIFRPEERMDRRAAVPPQARPEARFDGRPNSRVIARPTAPAPVVQTAPTVPTAPVARLAPALRPAPVVLPAAVVPLAPAAPPAPAAHVKRQSAEHAPRAREGAQRADRPGRDMRSSPATTLQSGGANPGARAPGAPASTHSRSARTR